METRGQGNMKNCKNCIVGVLTFSQRWHAVDHGFNTQISSLPFWGTSICPLGDAQASLSVLDFEGNSVCPRGVDSFNLRTECNIGSAFTIFMKFVL